jgi:hypothetical protein
MSCLKAAWDLLKNIKINKYHTHNNNMHSNNFTDLESRCKILHRWQPFTVKCMFNEISMDPFDKVPDRSDAPKIRRKNPPITETCRILRVYASKTKRIPILSNEIVTSLFSILLFCTHCVTTN